VLIWHTLGDKVGTAMRPRTNSSPLGDLWQYLTTLTCISSLLLCGLSVLLLATITDAQAPPRKNILVVNEVGVSHPAIAMVTQELTSGLSGNSDYQVEFYIESLDTTVSDNSESQQNIRELIIQKYQSHPPDVIVAIGPTPVAFLTSIPPSGLSNTPIVMCSWIRKTTGNPQLDSRFTGTWLQPAPAQTVDLAVRLVPDTRHIAIVAGTSGFDRERLGQTLADLKTYESKFDFIYLTDLKMDDLLGKLRQLPPHTIVLYNSFFRDAAGKQFVNATTALPMVANASDAPVFGMADSYLGHGIVGGNLMSFAAQAHITTRIVSAILKGTKPEKIPIYTAPNFYMFDWRELQRWHINEAALPAGSVVYFRQVSFWQRTWWIWTASLLIVIALSALMLHIRDSNTQLQIAKDGQRELSGLLISAQEKERSRLASELHDDFSQRLALLALGLENALETIPTSPDDAKRQLHELINSASELGADLHTLSHRLHSSTLESLGLGPAINALCKEFSTQQNVRIDLNSDELPRSIDSQAALCVFRIVQEALRNLKKYSGASEALVRLRRVGHCLDITVQDRGFGFDLRELHRTEGLGVRSMEERARLVGGEFRIRSAIGLGTTVEAWVPLDSEMAKGAV